MRLNGNTSVIAAALVVGAGAGYVAGLLTAPASGGAVRREIASRAGWQRRQLMRGGRHAFERATQGLERRYGKLRRTLAEAWGSSVRRRLA